MTFWIFRIMHNFTIFPAKNRWGPVFFSFPNFPDFFYFFPNSCLLSYFWFTFRILAKKWHWNRILKFPLFSNSDAGAAGWWWSVAPVGFCEVTFSLKSTLTTALGGRVPPRNGNVSHHQPCSAPSSCLPLPCRRWHGWGCRGWMLQREESWVRCLHLAATRPCRQKASPPMPQQLRLHSCRHIEPKVLLSKRFFKRYTTWRVGFSV